jgi:PIN domain nuclease of toxin-antitoxin system
VPADCVLDASAVLAVLFQEKGSQRVEPLLPTAAMSSVNMAEALVKLIRRGATPGEALEMFDALGIEQIVAFDEAAAFVSATLLGATASLGLGLGDRACLATGRLLGLPVVTADREWAVLDVGVKIRVIR